MVLGISQKIHGHFNCVGAHWKAGFKSFPMICAIAHISVRSLVE